jgi:hypothetical protein
MALRIGFDIDGVLADMERALVIEAEKLFGPSVTSQKPHGPAEHASMGDIVPSEIVDNAPLRQELQLTAKQRRQLWRHVQAIDNFWESLGEIEPGIVGRLATLVRERNWEVIFLTRRPETAGARAQIQTQRWLVAQGYSMPSVFVVTGSRGRIAAALSLDLMVDDTPENCVDIATDSRARCIAVFRGEDAPPVTLTRMGIHVVATTSAAFDLLIQIQTSLEHRPGAVERVLRSLGLRQPTGV